MQRFTIFNLDEIILKFHLEPCVHLQEVKVLLGVQEELDRAGTVVPGDREVLQVLVRKVEGALLWSSLVYRSNLKLDKIIYGFSCKPTPRILELKNSRSVPTQYLC